MFGFAVFPAFAQGGSRGDIGGGVIFQDLESDSGGTGFDPKGFFATFGWLAENGLLIRVDGGITEDETLAVGDIGFGSEAILDEVKITRLTVNLGYLFNRAGLVRPFLHGGLALLNVEDDFTGAASGAKVTVIDDQDSGLTLGAGLEIGQNNHLFLVDLSLDQDREVTSEFGPEVDFDLTDLHIGYAYRF